MNPGLLPPKLNSSVYQAQSDPRMLPGPCGMRKTELCFPSTVRIFPAQWRRGFKARMTDSHPKLPMASFFWWLFGKSSRAYFLGLVFLSVHMPWPDQCLVAQTQPSAKLEVGHDFWGFKDNAPQGTQSIAQTSDGFLWLGTPTGLYRFDGTRFELFHSPFGDQLLSTNVSALFAPPSGGLWIGYTICSRLCPKREWRPS